MWTPCCFHKSQVYLHVKHERITASDDSGHSGDFSGPFHLKVIFQVDAWLKHAVLCAHLQNLLACGGSVCAAMSLRDKSRASVKYHAHYICNMTSFPGLMHTSALQSAPFQWMGCLLATQPAAMGLS